MRIKHAALLVLCVVAIVPQFTFAQSASCSLSASPSSISNGSYTLLSWSSSGDNSFYVSGVGSESANSYGSAYVYPSQSTTYMGTATAPNDFQTVENAVEGNAYSFYYSNAGWSAPYGYWSDANWPYTQIEQLELIYFSYLDRAGDSAGMNYWRSQLNSGISINTVAQDFGATSEAESDYPFLASPSYGGEGSFITSLYARILYRSPDSYGYNYWYNYLSGLLSSGNTAMIRQFPATFAIGTSVGSTGYCYASVNVTQAPSCSISISPNPIAYGGGSYVTWNSQNATSLYIASIGYIPSNELSSGSTYVQPSQSTAYSGTASGSGGNAACNGNQTLTVTSPPEPTATISASSTSIQAGGSTNISATFAPGSGDSITADNIDSPVGSGLGANTGPGTQTIVFSTTTPGTYTFYARAMTGYYSSWQTLNSVTVTVVANPQCSIAFSPSTVTQGATSTLSYVSNNASSFSIDNGVGSETPDASGMTTVTPSQSTTYTGTATIGDTTNYCSATLNVSCQQAWSCNGNTIVQTNADCSTSNLATCAAPSFCSADSSSCIYPATSFNASDNKTGHLQLIPNIVQPGNTTSVNWNVSNAQSCTVTGANGDSWSGLSGSYSSKAITAATVYTLSCLAYGANPNVSEIQTVTITPTYREQ